MLNDQRSSPSIYTSRHKKRDYSIPRKGSGKQRIRSTRSRLSVNAGYTVGALTKIVAPGENTDQDVIDQSARPSECECVIGGHVGQNTPLRMCRHGGPEELTEEFGEGTVSRPVSHRVEDNFTDSAYAKSIGNSRASVGVFLPSRELIGAG
jgi:hypothetical protein